MVIPVAIQSGDQQMAGVLYEPAEGADSGPALGLVLCHAFASEKYDMQRMLTELATRLHLHGVYCLMFDYRGCGNSTGEFRQATLTSHCEDIRAAVTYLQRRHGVETLGLMGLRLGATLAAQVAATDERISVLLLWDPVFNPRQYFETMFARRRLLTGWQYKTHPDATMKEIKAQLLAGEQLDFGGYMICGALYNELVNWAFWEPTASFVGPVYLLTFLTPMDQHQHQHASALVQRGFPQGALTTEVLEVEKPMWWKSAAYLKVVALEEHVAETTTTWLQRQFRLPPAIPFPGGLPPAVYIGNEQHVVIPCGAESMLGVLQPAITSTQRRGVLFVDFHSGRTGLNDVFVQCARELGQSGCPSLRFDLRGRGDSAGLSRDVTFARVVADTLIALDYLKCILDLETVSIVSNCYGAFAAMYAAGVSAVVDKLVIWTIQPEMFELPELQAIMITGDDGPLALSLPEAVARFNGVTHFIFDQYDPHLETGRAYIDKLFGATARNGEAITIDVIDGPSSSTPWKGLVSARTRELLHQKTEACSGERPEASGEKVMMDHEEIRAVVRQLISRRLPEPIEFTDDESLFDDGLGLNSIHAMELLIEVEQVFKVLIDDDEMQLVNFINVRAITDLVSLHVAR